MRKTRLQKVESKLKVVFTREKERWVEKEERKE